MAKPNKTALLQTRKRLLEDFAFWAKNSCKIRTKAGEIVPLVLNEVQQRFVYEHIAPQLQTTGKIRSVILKGRQQGLSTVVSAYIYWWVSQRRGQKGIVIAHEAKSTDALFTMYKRIHKEIPELLRPSTKFSSKRELVFDELDGGMMVSTAGGDSIARGETLQCMHLSEVAFWPKTFAKENFNGLLQALPEVPGTMCFVESTANGLSGKFHDLWQGAVSGINGFVPFFSAWFESAEYREKPPAPLTLTPDEAVMIELFDLDEAQLYWRRRKVAQNGIELFKQEYPCTAEEAFITSGRPVFVAEIVQDMIAQARSPVARMSVETPGPIEEHANDKLVSDPRGELLVFHERDEGCVAEGKAPETYYIGADVSVGIRNPEKSDFCVAQVLDSRKRQVAVWRGQVTPDVYARVLAALGYYYNIALVAPERNGHGLLVCVRLWKDLSYPNVFMDLKEGQQADRDTLNLGFQTNVSSKPLIIDKLRQEVRTRDIEINDVTTLDEMRSFVVTDTGKMEGEEGCNDDCVMALAITNHIHEGAFTPITVTDDFYVRAI